MFSANARTVLERRYLKKDEHGQVTETPEDMFRRVAQNIASADYLYDPQAKAETTADAFYQAMINLDFLPNSPTLMNAGRELQQLSACFVLPVEDSMESIFEAIKNTALIHKSGGGTGFSFSRLRPHNDLVASTGGVASGPISFLKVFNAATDAVKQGGTRRGANMAILSVDHPDILDFINAKQDETTLTNFNLSVAITEEFMRAVEAGGYYDLINPRTKGTSGRLSAREVFEQIVERSWANGDPGIVFIDRMNKDNPTPNQGRIESTNPCGEQPLLPYESCNLGSINLLKMVRLEAGKYTVDYGKLASTVNLAVHFLDNVIDKNQYPLPIIAEKTKGNRKTGLGVMGFADMLIQLGIPYNSEAALHLGEDVMRYIHEQALEASEELGQSRGVFTNFSGSVYDAPGGRRVRNATVTTIAPTGSISIIAGCSSGIEPIFAINYYRHILDNDHLLEVNPLFEDYARLHNFYSRSLMENIAERGSVSGLPEVPPEAQQLFVTAHDIRPEWHVRMQAAFQRHTDNAVSKTINFPYEATKDDIRQAFILAYQEGCKGITIYRSGSRTQQVLATARPAADSSPTQTEFSEMQEASGNKDTTDAPLVQMGLDGHDRVMVGKITPRRRPDTAVGKTHKTVTGCGNLYVTINEDEVGLLEVFAAIGKAGGCASAQCEATTRLISLALRSGVDPDSVIRQLRGIRCPSTVWKDGNLILSCPDAIARVIEQHLGGNMPVDKPDIYVTASTLQGPIRIRNQAGQCPECSSLVEYVDGCIICRSCGYSKCG
jgi:ribonucleoside-diphosphate reductase alpha chain